MELQLCNMKSNHEIIQSSYTTVPLDHIRVRRSRSLNLPIKKLTKSPPPMLNAPMMLQHAWRKRFDETK